MKQGPAAQAIGSDTAAQRMDELRPFASTGRVVMAVLIGLALWAAGRSQPWVFGVVAAFGLWSAYNLWREVSGRGGSSGLLYFWGAGLALVCAMRGTADAHLLVVLLLTPIQMMTLLHGWRHGVALGIGIAVGLVIEPWPLGLDQTYLLPAICLALLAPAYVLAARPMAALRQRMRLVAELDRQLDPRRGVQAVGLVIADRLRQATAAQRVILCHRDTELPTVLVADQDDAPYSASPDLAGRLLALLADLPAQPMAFDKRNRPGDRLTEADPALDRVAVEPLAQQLAEALEAERLQLLPDAPGQARTGWLLVAYGPYTPRGIRPWPQRPLAAFATDMRRLLQPASYVDSLQAEIAAHERARIGRDLHDSALQPYLGLKFAIDVVAQRCTPDNPLHGQVQDLRQFCETELNELRDTVSLLRTGEVRGDNTLVPALRRQAKRFAALFGIQITLQVPDALVTSRALSAALLHMVNEAVNNVRRHTQAQNVWVSIHVEPDALHLVVRDDAGQRSRQPAPEFEPRSLTERAQELGGTLAVLRPNGLDTELHITIPV